MNVREILGARLTEDTTIEVLNRNISTLSNRKLY